MSKPTYDEVVADGARIVSLFIIAATFVALAVYGLATFHPEIDPGNNHPTNPTRCTPTMACGQEDK